jgi:hypothetical protein
METLEFDHNDLPHNLSGADRILCMTQEEIDEIIKDPSQDLRGISKITISSDYDGLSEHTEEEMIAAGETHDNVYKLLAN